MKRLIFVTLMMVCSASWADWDLLIKDNEANTVWHIDKSTIRRHGSVSKMWFMVSYLSTRKTADSKAFRSTLFFSEYDCAKEKSNLSATVDYSELYGRGKVVRQSNYDDLGTKWDPIVPNTFDEKLWKIACQKE